MMEKNNTERSGSFRTKQTEDWAEMEKAQLHPIND